MKNFYRFMMVIGAAGLLAGCSSTNLDGKPIPALTFETMTPVPVQVGQVDYVLNYNPGAEPQDISSRFVMSPHEALRRYTARRYVPAGGEQTLRVVVDDARVTMREIKQKNSTLKWANIGTEDEYELTMVVRAVPVNYGGAEGTSMQWKYRRTLVMPQSVSLAEREKRQIDFLELLIADIDKAMMEGLSGEMNLIR